MIQFKLKRIGQGTKAVHIKSAPKNVVSVNDTNKKNTILVKKQKEGEKNGHNTLSAAAAARDIGRERESERRGQNVMKERMMEVERK